MVCIYIVNNSQYGNLQIVGKTAKERLYHSLASRVDIIKEVEKVEDIPKNSKAIVLFDDMFFVKENMIETLINKIEKDESKAVRVGDWGFAGNISEIKNLEKLESLFSDEIISIKTPYDISNVYSMILKENVKKHMDNGVIIMDPAKVVIEDDVEIAPGVIIYENVKLRGNSIIEGGSKIFDGTDLFNAHIASSVKLTMARIFDSYIGDETSVGPFAYIRNGARIGKRCRLGDYIEIKNAILGDDVKMAHLAYVGDGEVGDRTNIGCGSIFVNYNGKIKQRTIVGEDAFIGSNVNLIAPLRIGNRVYIAAGSTVTKDLKDDEFCIAREREYIKQNWGGKGDNC